MFKVVMLGDGGVGKSCLTIQLVNNYFTYEYNPTIENSFRRQVTVDEECLFLEILDTAGQEEYTAMRDQHIMQGQGFALVYALDSRTSFEALPSFYNSIKRVKDIKSFPLTIFGNKVDIPASDQVVTASEGRELAKTLGDCPFFETSAKTRLNVEEAYFELVRQIIRFQASTPKKGKEAKKDKKSSCIIV